MLVFKQVAGLQAWLDSERREGKTIGFAPTMGALHQGHLGLVEIAKSECDRAVVSIFVNPTQFNDPADLEKYPRMPEQDIALLIGAGCDALFMPPVDEVYPPGLDLSLQLDFGALDQVMEGEFRPGHFGGMAMVVKRLLDIVQPHRLYMGQKDFQQLSIVRDMLRQLGSGIELVRCPTTREPDGLAMSSRNLRLSPAMRAAAPVIYQSMLAAKAALPDEPASAVQARGLETLRNAGLDPEYFDLVDGNTLLPVEQYGDSDFIVVCVAAWAGDVRLIDNLVIRENPAVA
ncbi:MAG: pantoate--beta-alanine ligase [Lewinellaceae bacterium]|nr:pantoate--beta-alanine ligase [Saprospiraceae bacterium]MCB9331879.1 pantoate--beta-alanine ligase [Lewinellaceae bacterium]